MSHIDSFKHQIVGEFGGIPVYRPLETIAGDFECTENQLMLGGGSGEHPVMVLKNPLAAVACFLHEEIPHLKLGEDMRALWESAIDSHITWDYSDILAFYDWDILTYHNFYEICTSDSLCNCYMDDISIEKWLVLGFGEFVFYAMPELALEIVSLLDRPYQYFHHIRYNNIMLVPPNMPVYANGGNAFKSLPNIKAASGL